MGAIDCWDSVPRSLKPVTPEAHVCFSRRRLPAQRRCADPVVFRIGPSLGWWPMFPKGCWKRLSGCESPIGTCLLRCGLDELGTGWDGCWWWAIYLESDSTELVPNTCAVAGKHIYGSQQLGWLRVSLRPQALQDQEILTATSPLQPPEAQAAARLHHVQRSYQAAAHHKILPYQIQDGFFPSATVHFSLHKQAGVPAISSEAPSGYTLPAAGNNPLYHALTIRPRISIRTVRPVRPPNHLSMDRHSLARTATPSTAS